MIENNDKAKHRTEKKPGKHSIYTRLPLPSKRLLYKILAVPVAVLLIISVVYARDIIANRKKIKPDKSQFSMLNYSSKGMISKILGKQEIYYPILSQLSQAKADAEPISSSVSSPTFGFGVTVSSDYLPQDSFLEGDFLKDKTVVIDPGHGDPGNQGSVGPNGAREADIVLDIAKKFRDLLEEHGARVEMTRKAPTTQLNNVQRGELANKENANIFVRIHADSSVDKSVGGTQVFFMKDNSSTAAKVFHDETLRATGLRDLGFTKSYSQGFDAANVPAISVNVATISNPAEEILLQSESFKQKVAQALYNATKIYLLTTLN